MDEIFYPQKRLNTQGDRSPFYMSGEFHKGGEHGRPKGHATGLEAECRAQGLHAEGEGIPLPEPTERGDEPAGDRQGIWL